MILQNCVTRLWCVCSRPATADGAEDIFNAIPPELLPNWAIEFGIGTAAIVLNSLIIYFILFKTPPELRDYRFFLFFITVHLDFNVVIAKVIAFALAPILPPPTKFGSLLFSQVISTKALHKCDDFAAFMCKKHQFFRSGV
jgi:hypothetical protein